MEGLQTFTLLLSCDKQTKKVGIFHSCQTMIADTGQNNKINNKSGDEFFLRIKYIKTQTSYNK